MASRIGTLGITLKNRDGKSLETAIVLRNKLASNFKGLSLAEIITQVNAQIPEKWQKFVIALIKVCRATDAEERFTLSDEMTKSIAQIAVKENGWIVIPLYRCCLELKKAATACGLAEHIETCSRSINSALKALMIEPESKFDQGLSKRYGYYSIANLLLSIYFQVRAYSLANGVINSTNTQKMVLPDFSSLAPQQQTAYLYYSGLLKFIDQRYQHSMELMEQAFTICASRNGQQVLLFYLVPLRIFLNHMFPSATFPWSRYPALAELYQPLIKAIKSGDIRGYRDLIKRNYSFLVSKHLYFIMQRLALRVQTRLCFKVWQDHNKTDKIDIQDFTEAFQRAGQFEGTDPTLVSDSTQLLLANQIHSGEVLGTIFASHKKVVLRKTDPFPYIRARASEDSGASGEGGVAQVSSAWLVSG